MLYAWLLAVMQSAPVAPWAFNSDSTIPIAVPSDIRNAAADLEYDDGQAIKGLMVDLNEDGSPEFVMQSAPSLCGANCVFLIVDGKTHRRLAQLNGARVQVESTRSSGYPAISVLSYEGHDSGRFLTLRYDGSAYATMAARSVQGNALERLVEQLRAVPVWRP